jgi:uncharacterized repeat protein (TIGR01451 family)
VESVEQASTATDDPTLPGAADPTSIEVLTPPDPPSGPQLSVTKMDLLAVDVGGDTEVNPGDTVEYTITVENTGDQPATAMRLTDPLPVGVTLVPGSITAIGATVTGTAPLIVEWPTLAAGTTQTISLRVTADPTNLEHTVVNQAIVASAELADVLSDDPASPGVADPTTTTIVPAVVPPGTPDLLLSKTARLLAISPDAHPGDTIEYQLVVDNAGDAPATAVVMTDPLPAGVELLADSLALDGGTSISLEPLVVAFASLVPGDSRTVSFQVLVLPLAGSDPVTISNQAIVESAELAARLSDDPAIAGPADPTDMTVMPLAASEPVEVPMLGLLARFLLAAALLGLGSRRTRVRR